MQQTVTETAWKQKAAAQALLCQHYKESKVRENLFNYLIVLSRNRPSVSSVKPAVSEQGCGTRGQWEEAQIKFD